MNPERWARIEEIFAAALEQPSEAREAYVRGVCGDDTDLADEVLSLIAERPPEDFLEAPDVQIGRPPGQGLAGRQLGPFKVQKEIGRGGMGVVYLAREEGLSRQVALKVLASSLLTTEREIERFHRGARAAAKLKHECIAQVYREGQDEGLHYFAMEYVEGPTLSEELLAAETAGEARVLPSREDPGYVPAVVRLIAKVARTLQYAHTNGIVHRDIKPQNLILDRRSGVKIVDFGISRDDRFGSVTRTGETLGTLRYMSPEQARSDEGHIDHRTDIYSLGVVLYESLAERGPYADKSDLEVLDEIREKGAPDLSQIRNQVPGDLLTILQAAMAADPSDRYSTAAHFAADLERFLDLRPIKATRPSLLRRATLLARRHRGRLVRLAGVLMVALLGMLLWLQWSAAPPPVVTIGGLDGAQVFVRTIDQRTGLVGEKRRLGRVPLKGLELEPGYYRFIVEFAPGDFQEYSRLLTVGDPPAEIEARPGPRPEDVKVGMVEIPGGRLTIPRLEHSRCPNREQAVEVPSFWIDEAEVSIAEYARFLDETGQEPPFFWEYLDLEALADRPATGMSWFAARAYAEWAGKRLVSHPEWELAARGTEAWLYPTGNEPQPPGTFNVLGPSPTADPQNAAAVFAEASADVRSFEEGKTPLGLYHMFGNVAEWTESVHTEFVSEVRAELRPERRILLGAAWDVVASGFSASLDWHAHKGPESSYARLRYGFRCAKSSTP